MAKPHILFLNAAEGFGADVAVHASLARALDRSRVRVSAATNVWESLPGVSARETFAAIPDLTLLPLDLGKPLGPRRGLARAQAIASNARGGLALSQLAIWARRNHVDLVHVTERPRQTLFGLYVARLAGCACLVHAHTSIYPGEATRLVRWRLKQADAIVGVSKFTTETYPRIAGVPADKVFAVLNAVNPRAFTPEIAAAGRASMRRRLGLPADVPVIACVARMSRWKAQHTIIDAFAQLRGRFADARLVLAGLPGDTALEGPGDFRDYLMRRADGLGLATSVSFPGFLSQADMPRFYGAIDVLAHPSHEEPFGLVLVEAMASGKPVVAVDGGGVPEIITSGRDGYLVPREAPGAMADAVMRVLCDPVHAREIGDAGRRRVLQAFTPEIQADAMLRVYQRVLTPRTEARMPVATALNNLS
ncbi:MAG: glycosyltransferase family 4 protein [Chloroflexi bacterium]|nr:glycosyltransferase family 4 protein [Chloroflexota bacterium]MBV9598953.1 glycosyltransferase family 4 protein [Chloroflexota bacterium]